MKLTSLVCSLAALTGISVQAQAIVGSWSIQSADGGNVAVTFLRNGVYIIAEDGPADSDGQAGMERGTYRWNPTTKAFSVQTLVDTNGEWGFSHDNFKSATVQGSQLTIVTRRDSFTLERVASSASPLVGAWYLTERTGYAVLIFLADGRYFMAQDDVAEDGGRSGMERGTFQWNSSTYLFTRTILTDTNGSWGLSGDEKFSFKVTKNQLAILDGDESTLLARVVAPNWPLIGVEQPIDTFLKDGITKKNFGTVTIGSTGKSRVFTILNNGTANLTNLAISKSGSHKGNFKVGALATTTLKPGESAKFKITFNPSATGTRNAAIAITSNYSKSGPFDILLTGVGAE